MVPGVVGAGEVAVTCAGWPGVTTTVPGAGEVGVPPGCGRTTTVPDAAAPDEVDAGGGVTTTVPPCTVPDVLGTGGGCGALGVPGGVTCTVGEATVGPVDGVLTEPPAVGAG
jgi:hypothetical protein